MATWKTSPRIDVELGKRIIKLKTNGSKVRGLSSFLAVHDSCWRDQATEDGLPRRMKIITRLVREERQKVRSSLSAMVAALGSAGIEPEALFASLGLPSPAELAKLDDARLSSEAQRLCTSFGRTPKLRRFVALNLRVRAERLEGNLKSIRAIEEALAAAPKKARARVKRWNAALAKFRVAATRAGVKVRGL